MATPNRLVEPTRVPSPASAARKQGLAPGRTAAILALQRDAGNKAVTSLLAPAPAGAPKLRTAEDSKLVVTPSDDGYVASLQLIGEGEPVTVQVASYKPRAGTPLERLPVYLEDVLNANGSEAVVNVRYDPAAADVTASFATRTSHGVDITVRMLPSSDGALTVATAPKAHQVGADGMNIDGKEKVTQHSSASSTDMVMGSIASAEGGFASVEGADAGVLTWGQGQWTVTAGELQSVLAFIKDRRRDLFDRYWGAADLDVDGKDFVHDKKHWPPTKTQMMALFRPDLDTIKDWATIFGQAGMDPQIQRLQREYLRKEVHETLGHAMGGHTPESVLDTRGQAYYYSMEKNLPSVANASFRQALKSVTFKDGEQVRDEQKTTISEALGELFHQSSVVAFDNAKHHIIGFWGEGGRTRALDQADEAISKGGDHTWSVKDWKKHRDRMAARESRYTKTRADIDAAIAHQEIEPDIPAGTFTTDPTPAPAAGATPAPGLLETAGEEIGELVDDAGLMLELAATGIGIAELRIVGSVGRGGKNHPKDVAAVAARMLGLGFPPGRTLAELGAAIALYQTTVVGMPAPDGRIDPGGGTIAALRAGRHEAGQAPAPAAATSPAPAPAAAAAPTPAPVRVAAAAPAAPAVTPAKPTGPRPTLSDPAVEKLVTASSDPAVQAAAADLAQLEKTFAGLKHNDTSEEVGKGRDDLVLAFRELRAKVALLDVSLQPHFYRAMNAVSPYYYQGLNIILEFDRVDKTTGKVLSHVWNTCNITSLSMCLEALGRSSADYKYRHLIASVARVFKKDVDEKAHDKVGTELDGLRLPDYVAMAAIVWKMDYQERSDKEITDAALEAFKHVASTTAIATLARDFGVTAKEGGLTLDPSEKRGSTREKLSDYGATHSHEADAQARAETRKKATPEQRQAKAGGLSTTTIEHDVPLERYKTAALAQVAKLLDGGHEVVVGQFNHFVRLQSMTEDAVIKDDPGNYYGVDETLTWEEARALGLFLNWVVIG